MKTLTLTLVLAAACSPTTKQAMPEATGPTAPAPAAAAPSQTVVLRWASNGDAFAYADVVRHRLVAGHLDGAGVGVVFRGTTLEVQVPNATPDRIAIARRAVEAPYDVHFANAAGTTLQLDRATLVDGYTQFDPTTNRPQVRVEVTPAAAPQLADLAAHGPVDLVVDGAVISHADVNAPITQGKLLLTMGGADPAQAEAEADRIASALRAAKHGPLTYVAGS